jgi:hypothetical protein
MLCCHKTGVQVVRCKENILNNPSTPKSLGYASHPVIYTGLLALVTQSSKHEDNYDEAGMIKYATYILMLDEIIYQAQKWQVIDTLAYNDGKFAMSTAFDPLLEKKEGKIYSIREVPPLRSGRKYREVKIRFDYKS